MCLFSTFFKCFSNVFKNVFKWTDNEYKIEYSEASLHCETIFPLSADFHVKFLVNSLGIHLFLLGCPECHFPAALHGIYR